MKFLFLLLISLNVFSQDLATLKSSDTVYVYFDEKQSFDDLHLKTDSNKTIKNYFYVFPDSGRIQFQANLLKDHGAVTIKKKACFLKKYRDVIITTEFIHQSGLNNTIAMLSKIKVIFIIDRMEIKSTKLVLRKCYFRPDIITID